MFEIIFFALMVIVFGRIAFLAVKLTWGFVKVLFTLVFLPVTLVIALFAGLINLALPILIVIGIISLLIK